MQLTKFEHLKAAIKLLGAQAALQRLQNDLNSGRDIVGDEIIIGETGIFTEDEYGHLTKVLIYISSMNMNPRFFAEEARSAVEEKDFEDTTLVGASHRYHSMNCRTLEKAHREGWEGKYKATYRKDGTFFYRYIGTTGTVAESKDQRLLPCKNCVSQYNDIFGETFDQFDFETERAFDDALIEIVNGQGLEPGIAAAPNEYAEDWEKISRRQRERANYQCSNPECIYPDLSEKGFHKFLHCHHVSRERSDNRISNLRVLCIRCHAEEPNHSHMRDMPAYVQYVHLLSKHAQQGK